MPTYVFNFNLRSSNRVEMRKDLINQFMSEVPGNGKGNDASHYIYNVETLNSEYSIQLKRPTQLNKGFDFTVHIVGMYFRNKRRYSNPSHADVKYALIECKERFASIYETIIMPTIEDLYNCCDVQFETLSGATFSDYQGSQHPIEIILLAIKWLFMEQDCAYWNYSGRKMLYEGLKENYLV